MMVVGRLAYLNTLGNDDGLIIKTLTCEIAALHVQIVRTARRSVNILLLIIRNGFLMDSDCIIDFPKKNRNQTVWGQIKSRKTHATCLISCVKVSSLT